MHLGGFPDQTELQIWIVNFRTDDCSKVKSLTRALQWIKEIEAAKSLDDLITPKSITGKNVTEYAELIVDGDRIETVLQWVSANPKDDPSN